MSSSPEQIIEHVVLFKVKDGTDPSRVNAMVDGLNALISLDSVLHLAAGLVLRTRSSSSPSTFTIMLHGRYRTKDDLAAYAHHQDHMRVVKELGSPICEDIMAVDWVTDRVPVGAVALLPGSPIRVSLLKLKEGSGEEAKGEVLSAVAEGIRDGLGGMEHATWGENFSPSRSKGFSIASLAVFKGIEEMEAAAAGPRQEKVEKYVDGMITVDYAVPHPQPAGLSL
ncbi:stress-response A/B barrel domain-containing protein UP3-like [Rhodamnia argentea]|uniref:Stress-response A/B barrel domain-containing protein UP3-like n=1 Tax=Rhodamnia argentea TaxID=178133 RepID=A0A8B8Q8I4_9MYRT|nr:stress-response A/B barrel domain-containing protein UP3-like [Rhodamnia argentea]